MRKAAVSRPGGAVWGLSCVESQVLSLIEEAGWDPACCYAGSLVSFAGLYDYFIAQNRPYAYFDLAVKAQDWLKSIGALAISRLPLEDVLEGLEGDGGCLLPLTVEAVGRLFGKTPWRPDHYLLARRDGGRAVLWDDIQPVPVQVPLEELPGLLAGPGLRVRLIRPPDEKEKAAFRMELTRTARRLQRQYRDGLPSAPGGPEAQDLIRNPAQGLLQDAAQAQVQARDMVGMARLLAKRLMRLLEAEGRPVEGLGEATGELDRTYARMQYALRRGRGGMELIPPALAQVRLLSRRLAESCAGEEAEAADGKRQEL
ncbi:MAG: hypothetical protein HFE86_09290 [Clostridiales bacterium]|nr:hypothetical protein [Clostridiales bacterium]